MTMAWSKQRRRRHRVIKQIYLRAQVWKCAYCGRRISYNSATYDHVVPRSRGGLNELQNKVLTCEPCNIAKADELPSAFEIAAAKRIYEVVEMLVVNRFGRKYFMGMEAQQTRHPINLRANRITTLTLPDGLPPGSVIQFETEQLSVGKRLALTVLGKTRIAHRKRHRKANS